MRRWGKAGVRLTEQEAAARAREIIARRNQAETSRKAATEQARRRWADGLMVPWCITVALDALSLYGPEVDVQCNAHEPEVDLWEEGRLYPRWDQVEALAVLTGKSPGFFMDEPRVKPGDTTLRFHLRSKDETPPVLRFTDYAIHTRFDGIPESEVKRGQLELW